MYLHKENRELFRDVILLTSQRLEVSEDIVEKDYYVTLILKKLSAIERRRNAQESYKLKKGFVNNHKKYFIKEVRTKKYIKL